MVNGLNFPRAAILALALACAAAPGAAAAATCTASVIAGTATVANVQNDVLSIGGPPIFLFDVRPEYLGDARTGAILGVDAGPCQASFLPILIDGSLRPGDLAFPESTRLYKVFYFEVDPDPEYDALAYASGDVLRLEILSDGREYPTAADVDPDVGLGEFVGFGTAQVRLSPADLALAPLAAVAQIPLPAGAGLLGTALGALLLGARRRRLS